MIDLVTARHTVQQLVTYLDPGFLLQNDTSHAGTDASTTPEHAGTALHVPYKVVQQYEIANIHRHCWGRKAVIGIFQRRSDLSSRGH